MPNPLVKIMFGLDTTTFTTTPVLGSKMAPTVETDAYEDGIEREVPIVFLGGPIAAWWDQWGSWRHDAYLKFRRDVRSRMIALGYLTYAPWAAIKGTWTPQAQRINNAAIRESNLFVELYVPGVPAHGTDDEVEYARSYGVEVARWDITYDADFMTQYIVALLGDFSERNLYDRPLDDES